MVNPPPAESDKQIEGLNSTAVGIAIKWMSRFKTWAFKTTSGRFGDKWRAGPTVAPPRSAS